MMKNEKILLLTCLMIFAFATPIKATFASGTESGGGGGSSSSGEESKGDERSLKRDEMRKKMRETKEAKQTKSKCEMDDLLCVQDNLKSEIETKN
jgi:hypothetical protein